MLPIAWSKTRIRDYPEPPFVYTDKRTGHLSYSSLFQKWRMIDAGDYEQPDGTLRESDLISSSGVLLSMV